MKIYITGLSCVGKTTLATRISKKFKIPYYELDRLLIDKDSYASKLHSTYYVNEKELRRQTKLIQEKANWIVEGVYVIEPLIKEADLVIYIESNLLRSLALQWSRFLADGDQRKRFGLINNLRLSRSIIRQNLGVKKNTAPLGMVQQSLPWTKLTAYREKMFIVKNFREGMRQITLLVG